uniref:Pollen-specific protein SF3 n=1 Tax=Cajanus cajan TaxID=3821 RepID=A0A151S3P9_CAJCA|nr:LOW QUALITY PROTEIN: Pollen-specific protein SF3 [Cajanus cajan]
MSFTGTLDKCNACDKTVYVVDLLTLEGIPYHKNCFKCSHCKGHLTMCTYSSMDGVLYCKTHFEQLFKESGNFNKNFAKSTERQSDLVCSLSYTYTLSIILYKHLRSIEKLLDNLDTIFNYSLHDVLSSNRAPSKVSSMFSGTLDKCSVCSKTVYPLEKMTLEGECFHKTCFRCEHAGCPLTHSNYAALDGVLYCRVHFAQLFMEKGNYSHVLQAAAHKRTGSSTPPEPLFIEEPSHAPEESEDQTQEEETS